MTSSGKVRIYELSKDLGLENKDVLDAAEKLSISAKSHSSSISDSEAGKIRNLLGKGGSPSQPAASPAKPVPGKSILSVKKAPTSPVVTAPVTPAKPQAPAPPAAGKPTQPSVKAVAPPARPAANTSAGSTPNKSATAPARPTATTATPVSYTHLTLPTKA